MNNNHFSNEEYADMHLIYGECRGNALQARRMYMERFPNRRIPNDRTFININIRLRATGSFKGQQRNAGRRNAVNAEQEYAILNFFEENSRRSIREASRHFNMSPTNIWRILSKNGLHPFHFRRVQELLPTDHNLRVVFCREILHNRDRNPQFTNKILFTDEALFTRDGIFNYHNMHEWSHDNPHSIMTGKHQHTFSLNVWCGIIGDILIGPFILPRRLGGAEYLDFLQNNLFELLEDLPLQLRHEMFFMQDGAPAHFSLVVRQWLGEHFPGRWIGRGQDAPIQWPPRSPDLNPLDFHLWGHLKNAIYSTEVNSIEELQERIFNISQEIRASVHTLRSVNFNFIKRLRLCQQCAGDHFEHLL